MRSTILLCLLTLGCSSQQAQPTVICKWPNPAARILPDSAAGMGPWQINLTGFQSQSGCCDDGRFSLMFRSSPGADHAACTVLVADETGKPVFESDPDAPHMEKVDTFGQGYVFALPFDFDTFHATGLQCGWTITINLAHSDGVVQPDGTINVIADGRVIIRCSTVACATNTPPGGPGGGGEPSGQNYSLTPAQYAAAILRGAYLVANSTLVSEPLLDEADMEAFAFEYGMEY